MSSGDASSIRPIVLVDDDRELLAVSRERIERALPGVQVLSFDSGPEAASAIEDLELGLVILDVDMPVMSGIELARILRARDTDLPILFLTGTAQPDIEQECQRLGHAACLRKPVSGEALISAIESLARR